jgi:hypothetical protein
LTRHEKRASRQPYVPSHAERVLAAALVEDATTRGGDVDVDVAFLVGASDAAADDDNSATAAEDIVWYAAAPSNAPAWDSPVMRLVLGRVVTPSRMSDWLRTYGPYWLSSTGVLTATW